jgi:DNA-binding NarL/FixJ family response regulator
VRFIDIRLCAKQPSWWYRFMTAKILVVDDDSDIHNLLNIYLKKFIDDFEIVSAFGGREAVQEVEKMKGKQSFPHLTLMDLKMSDMDGIECTKKLLEIGVDNIWVLTAYLDADLIANAVAAGVKGILKKSEGFKVVSKKVAEMLRGK